MSDSVIQFMKRGVYRLVTQSIAGLLLRRSPQMLHDLGWQYMRQSGLGLGAYPVPFQPAEFTAFADTEAEVQRYVSAMRATQMEWSDNFPKRCRFYILTQMVEYALTLAPDGAAIAECGCWWGHSTVMIAQQIAQQPKNTRFFVFDSFQGLSDYKTADMSGLAPGDRLAQADRQKFFAADLATVQQRLAGFDFVQILDGWIPERFSEVKDHQFALVHVDVDMHQPTLDSLVFFYDRLISGGCIVLDDYGSASFPGAKQAVDEFLLQHQPKLFLKMPTGGAILIKQSAARETAK